MTLIFIHRVILLKCVVKVKNILMVLVVITLGVLIKMVKSVVILIKLHTQQATLLFIQWEMIPILVVCNIILNILVDTTLGVKIEMGTSAVLTENHSLVTTLLFM